MADRSAIEWLRGPDGTPGASWNPIRGTRGQWSCVKVSPGCTRCYAERFNVRLGGPRYVAGADTLRLNERVLQAPLRWTRPRLIFPQSMGDLFEARVPDTWIGRMFGVMAEAWWHTFIMVTKRAARLASWSAAVCHYPRGDQTHRPVPGWPPNVRLLVSAETQQYVNLRAPHLLGVRAAIRGVSLEPLLGAMDLRAYLAELHWVIVGAESGAGARPMDVQWVRQIRDQCVAYEVAFFFKQHCVDGRKISTPELDGRRWVEQPT